MIGWDAVNKAVLGTGFDSLGNHWITRYTDLTTTRWAGTAVGWFDGKPWESKVSIEFEEEGYRYEDVTGGKPWVSVSRRAVVFPAPMPAEVKKAVEKLVIGDWTSEVKFGDRQWTATTSRKWSPAGDFLFSDFTITSEKSSHRMQSVLGWDSRKKALTEAFVSEAGEYAFLEYTEVSEGHMSGRMTGMVMGQPWDSKARFRIENGQARWESVLQGKPYVWVSKRKAGE